MRIFLTGGSGKAGRHVVPYLLEQGHTVTNVDRAPLGIDGVTDLDVDLTDLGQVISALRMPASFDELDLPAEQPYDAIVHLAAVPAILLRADNATYANNVLSTWNVLEAAAVLGIPKVVFASSETTYGICFARGERKPDYLPVDEEHPTVPEDAYATSKVVNEVTARSVQRRTGADVYGLRINNVIEPHEYAEKFPGFVDDPAQRRRAPGHAALDAPAIVSGVLCLSAVAAERRVRDAVRRAADGPGAATGLGGLHAAMAAGRLDAYRAQVLAHELEECPAEVAASVIDALDEHFAREDATRLRRRARRLLARVSPDLLRQRAERARSESGLRRWVDEPGVDTWLGTFPSEDARTAWAAIDALAQRYLTDGVCSIIDRARAKALTDLVTQQSTVTTVVVEHTAHPVTGAFVDLDDTLATTAYRPSEKLAAFVRARDTHCRFPGCSVAARFCDLDHVIPWPAGPTSAANLVCLCRRHHRTKQRPGWSTALAPDGTYTVTDPTGRTRTTDPPDQRPSPSLWEPGEPDPPPPSNPSLVLPDGPHSALEHRLESTLGGRHWGRAPCRVEIRVPSRPVGVTTDHVRSPRRRPREPWPDTPPF